MATTALVLGIIGIGGALGSCCCCLAFIPGLCAPVAWYLGSKELRDIRSGLAPQSGEQNAKIGMILGIVGCALLAVYLLFLVAYIGLVGFAGALEALKSGGVPKVP
jgi:hypothetical protein